ncbi:DUF1003 domain-containing protein [Zavarzinia sp. CC-PAN008]|uniref:DUF1003 domain-containing protein n=1 Tax=Zavarzinia sp. CC-PAN008 TaxID=3243332 RepID=UPI003F7457F1
MARTQMIKSDELLVRILGERHRHPGPERRVHDSVQARHSISRDLSRPGDQDQTFGNRLADQVARFGGSWTFILVFTGFMLAWAALNSLLLTRDAFDPYPFVFLNLILSMLAALQAPVIMMSQNRQAQKDREAAQHDYEVNLKAEIEIMALHEKMDAIRLHHMAEMIARQEQTIALLQRMIEAKGDAP